MIVLMPTKDRWTTFRASAVVGAGLCAGGAGFFGVAKLLTYLGLCMGLPL